MKGGVCPKCASRSVYRNSHRVGQRGFIYVSLFSGLKVDEYICTDCGFIESYMADMAQAGRVVERCDKVAATE